MGLLATLSKRKLYSRMWYTALCIAKGGDIQGTIVCGCIVALHDYEDTHGIATTPKRWFGGWEEQRAGWQSK